MATVRSLQCRPRHELSAYQAVETHMPANSQKGKKTWTRETPEYRTCKAEEGDGDLLGDLADNLFFFIITYGSRVKHNKQKEERETCWVNWQEGGNTDLVC